MEKKLFKLCEEVNSKTNTKLYSLIGLVLLMLIWYLITYFQVLPSKILPKPVDVITSIPVMFKENDLLGNMWYSISLNFSSYFYAIIISLPLGLMIALVPINRIVFGKYIDSLRFLPIPALSGIFIAILGLGFNMKVSFLAFSLIIYILPAVANKVYDLQNPANDKDYVYLQTIKTLGASSWQKIRYVYFPYVTSKISSEIINLTGVSWSYVVIAELLNKDGGIGALINTMSRQSRTAEMYALLFLIIFIGVCQDIILRKADTVLFPYKYNKRGINWNWLKKLIYK